MADRKGNVACDDRCGCPSPCDGGNTCRCMEHKQCSCGQHCGCNPCSCSSSGESNLSGTSTGKAAFCKCGAACTCPTCAAPT